MPIIKAQFAMGQTLYPRLRLLTINNQIQTQAERQTNR